jgi:hypothetical protein
MQMEHTRVLLDSRFCLGSGFANVPSTNGEHPHPNNGTRAAFWHRGRLA